MFLSGCGLKGLGTAPAIDRCKRGTVDGNGRAVVGTETAKGKRDTLKRQKAQGD